MRTSRRSCRSGTRSDRFPPSGITTLPRSSATSSACQARASWTPRAGSPGRFIPRPSGDQMTRYPSRIVCLTEETTETLYLLGQGDRIVGVSGYTVRPPEARLKPKVSAFINAKFDKIESLKPDLVLAFSDLQADLAAELVRRGMNVVVFNQRSVAEILQMIAMLGGLVGCQREAERLADRLAADLDRVRDAASRFPDRLRVFFEE